MREVIIRIKSDLDNDLVADKTIQFGFDTVQYEIDLTAEEADTFAGVMQEYVDAARKVKRQSRAKASPVTANGQAEQVVTRDKKAETAAQAERLRMRKWANANGFEVSARGVIPRNVVEAYKNRKAVKS